MNQTKKFPRHAKIITPCLLAIGLVCLGIVHPNIAHEEKRILDALWLTGQYNQKNIFLDKQSLQGSMVSDAHGGKRIIWRIKGRTEDYFVIGDLYDVNGQNLTAANMWRIQSTEVPSSPPSDHATTSAPERISADKLLGLAQETLSGFNHFGSDRPFVLYAFIDPDCAICKTAMDTVDQLEQEFSEAQADIRWLPVTILSRDRTKSGRMLIHGRAGLDDNATQPDEEILNRVDLNTAALLYSRPEPSVPYFFWQSSTGVDGYIGSPSSQHWKMILESLGKSKNLDQGEK